MELWHLGRENIVFSYSSNCNYQFIPQNKVGGLVARESKLIDWASTDD